jgi:hypothetical protein
LCPARRSATATHMPPMPPPTTPTLRLRQPDIMCWLSEMEKWKEKGMNVRILDKWWSERDGHGLETFLCVHRHLSIHRVGWRTGRNRQRAAHAYCRSALSSSLYFAVLYISWSWTMSTNRSLSAWSGAFVLSLSQATHYSKPNIQSKSLTKNRTKPIVLFSSIIPGHQLTTTV